MFKDCRAYLSDNPEGYWFKRKLYGYGWIPALWQGWALTVLYFLIIIGMIVASSPDYALIIPDELVMPMIGVTLLYVAIIWKTGEPLKWQWGLKKDADITK